MEHRRATYSVDEAAELVGVSRSSVYEAIRRGELRAVQIGRRLVIPRTAIEQMLGARLAQDESLPEGAGGVNRVQLVGTLLRAPTMRVSRRGLPYATLRLRLGDVRDSERFEVDVVAFGNRASAAANCVAEERIRVEGRLAPREWQADDGARRTSYRIVADRILSHALPDGAVAPST